MSVSPVTPRGGKLAFALILGLLALLIYSPSRLVAGEAAPRYRPGQAEAAAPNVRTAGGPDEDLRVHAPARFFGVPKAGATASPGAKVGETFYDWQHNGSTGRQVDKFGDAIQVSYMRQSLPQFSPGRKVYWNRVSVTGSPGPLSLDNGDMIDVLPLGAPASALGTEVGPEDQQGYTNLRLTPKGEAVVFYHSLPDLDSWAASVDSAAANGKFNYAPNPFPAPRPPELSFGFGAIWPKGTVDVVGTDTVLHVVAQESLNIRWLYYWRGVIHHFGSVASIVWADPVLLDTAQGISAVIEADPTSDKVAVVYTQNDNFGYNLTYRLSTDGGLSWGSAISITNYSIFAEFWPSDNVSAAYDEDGTLQVVYCTSLNLFGTPSITTPTKLWHWNDVRGTSRMITAAYWANTCSQVDSVSGGGGNFHLQLEKPSISVKPAGAGPGGGIADEVLYAVWVQFGPTQTDCATQADGVTLGGYVNAELWCSGSSDDGLTWDKPQNITGTETPDCVPGDCHSEHWVTAAARADSGVYLSYTDDTHAGGMVLTEGTWSLSPYMVLALEARAPAVSPRLVVLPVDPTSWTRPYWDNQISLVGPPAGVTTDKVSIWNPGNTQLNFTATIVNDGDASNIPLVNGLSAYSSSIAVGGSPETLTVSYDPVGSFNELDFRLEITSNAALAQRNRDAAPFTIQWTWGGVCPITLTGDLDQNGFLQSADVIRLVNYVFKSGATPVPCEAAGDADCSGAVQSADIIRMVNHVFKSGIAPCNACTSTLAAGC